MKKLVLALVLACSFLLAGCSSGVSQEEYDRVVAERDEYKAALESLEALPVEDNNDIAENDSSDENNASNTEPEKVQLIESGWVSYQSGDWTNVKYAVKMENPNSEYAIMFPTITITAKDEEGKILSTDERVLLSIAAGDSIYYGDEISYEGDEPAQVDISVSNSDRDFTRQDDSEYARQSDFVVSNISENVGSYDVRYTGEVTNNSSIDFDTVAVIIIFKQGDNIVAGDIEYVDDLMAGSTKAFELTSDSDMIQYDSYEFYAVQW